MLCLGTIVDESGRKMSKHIGNVLAPLPLMEQHGADALRWFFAGTGSPWATRRLSVDALGEIVRKVILTYWNTTSFLVLYASDWTPGSFAVPGSLLDRWVLSSLHALVRDVTTALDSFDAAAAARRLAAFIDDLSNWYVRRARRRFWDADPAAFGTPARVLAGADLADGAVHAVPDRLPVGSADRAVVGTPRRLAFFR